MNLRSLNRVISASLAASFFLLASPPTMAQDSTGLPIVEIEFVGLVGLPAESLEFYLELERGRPFNPVRLNENIHELWKRQLIDDIRVTGSQVEGGVKLTIAIEERPTLRTIEYDGIKRVSRTDIVDRISRDNIRVREGDSLNFGELSRLQAAIEDLYREKGFRLAQADFLIETVSPTERNVSFTIDEGDKIRIAEIDFEGNTVFGDRRLQWAMRKTKESGIISRILKKDIYKPAVFEEDLDEVREVYRKAGYKNIVIGEPRVELERLDGPVRPEDPKRKLIVTIPLEEGRRWKLGDVRIEGNETFEAEILARQFPDPRGGWLRSTSIDKGIEALSDLYSNTGHLYAQVTHAIVEVNEEEADVIVTIVEGDQFSVGRIEFEGNTKTRDKVLRRELGIQEGMVLNAGALRNSLLRLGQLQFFEVDENDPVTFEFHNEDKLVDLTIKGQEGDRTEMQFGAGYSEVDGFFGQFMFRTRNFLGRGETLGVSFQSGDRQDLFDLSYSVPWFLDRPQSLGVQVFQRNLNYQLLDGQAIIQDTTGGTITYGRNLSLFRSLSFGLSIFEAEDLRRQFIFGSDELIEQNFSRDVRILRTVYGFDRRDSRIEPTRGSRHSLSVEWAGGALGGDSDFVRPRAAFSIYKPVTRGVLTVAAINIEAGIIEPIGDGEIFFQDRFYLGGENSIRGYRYRGIWVRDEDGNTVVDEFGYPLGGESFAQVNLEYHFVLGGPFRIIAFADAGNVYSPDQSIDLGNMRYSAGVEMRVMVPVFGAPLRFIYATNPGDEYLDDRFESFQFSVGTTF
jgi:outer membrane protein insertion porin family